VDNAVAAANAGPAERQSIPSPLSDVRSVLVASPHFILEHIDLPPNSNWRLDAEQETWVLVIEGDVQVELMNAFVGDAIFVEADHASLKVGSHGLRGLLAYLGPEPNLGLLQNLDRPDAQFPVRPFPRSPHTHRATAGSSVGSTEVPL